MVRTFVLAVASIAVVVLLVPLRDDVRSANLALLLVLVVLATAVVGGRRAGIVVGVVVAVAFDFFPTQPYQSFTIEEGADVQTTILLGLVGLVGGELVDGRDAARRTLRAGGGRSSACTVAPNWRRSANRPAG